jgi:soluble epoxide hydrolase/lipid-phosphate phosphatase
VQAFPHLAYQVYFADQTSAAVAELNADIRRTLRATLRTVASPPPADFLLSNSSYLAGWKNVSNVSLEKMCMLFLLSSMWMLF